MAEKLNMLGDVEILQRRKVALLCSQKCPGALILETYDLCQHFRATGVTVISGFHSPMEQECLRILLRSPHPQIWCLARGLMQRIPSKPVDCQQAAADGRLLIVSPFPATVKRITADMAVVRNRTVAELADAVVIPYAAPGSRMEVLSRALRAEGKPLYTFNHPANADLLSSGALPVDRLAYERTMGSSLATRTMGSSLAILHLRGAGGGREKT